MKFEKTVIEKKASVFDELGRVKWQIREEVIFVCPSKLRNSSENSTLVMLSEPLSEGTNGRAKKFKKTGDDESVPSDMGIQSRYVLWFDKAGHTVKLITC